jgi:TFIIF-interacting CTD phosphatase-like protein
VYHFQLYGSGSPWYHTRLRPGTQKFLSEMSRYYELHICTFGARNYAHMIAMFLDHDGQFFSHRILSRDECFNPHSKTANLAYVTVNIYQFTEQIEMEIQSYVLLYGTIFKLVCSNTLRTS